LNRYAVSLVGSVVVTAAYCLKHYYRHGGLNVFREALVLSASCFALILNVHLLISLSRFEAKDFGKLDEERQSLILGIFIVTIFLAISVIQSFVEMAPAPRAGVLGVEAVN
jgi:hypothetical protein